MAIRGILFDKDGTLLDFYQTWSNVNWQLARHAADNDENLAAELMTRGGYDHATGRIIAGSPLAWAGSRDLAALFAPHLTGPAFEALVDDFKRIFYEGARRDAQAVEGLKPALEKLKTAGYKLGIATTDNEAGISGTLDRFDILHLFDFAAGSDSGHGMKPDPGMVHGFCAATGLQPREIAVVGDNVHDLEMGRAAGAGLRVGVLTGTSSEIDLRPFADQVFQSLVELPDFLEKL